MRTSPGVKAAHLRALLHSPEAHDNWPFPVSERGYAQLVLDGRKDYLHVHACTLAHGPRPAGLQALHACRHLHCFWAEHLSWGTPTDNNNRDKRRDGTIASGSRNGNAKLTDLDVLAIRSDPRPQRQIAVAYGIGQSQVSRIKSGARWR